MLGYSSHTQPNYSYSFVNKRNKSNSDTLSLFATNKRQIIVCDKSAVQMKWSGFQDQGPLVKGPALFFHSGCISFWVDQHADFNRILWLAHIVTTLKWAIPLVCSHNIFSWSSRNRYIKGTPTPTRLQPQRWPEHFPLSFPPFTKCLCNEIDSTEFFS